MADPERKAHDLMLQANKKARSPKTFFGSVFGVGSDKADEAADLYVKAANSFKMAKKWGAAGNAFCESAKLHSRQSSKHEAASNYAEAANCFRKADPKDAVKCLTYAIDIYTDMGRFNMAAKHHVTLAEIYETELVNLDRAILNYERAADYYSGERSSSSANKCLMKIAEYAAKLEQYSKAIDIYEKIGQSCMDNNLLRYGAKDHFFRAAMCRMCQDVYDAEMSLQKYSDMFPAFSDSRECKLLKSLIEAVKERNVDDYTKVLREYDTISRLQPWYTTLLLRVKKTIEGTEIDLK